MTSRLPLSTLLLWLLAASALAVQPPPRSGDERPDKPTRRSWLARIGGVRLFDPLPEDYRPLEPEERAELQYFVRTYAPELHRQLRRLQQRDPELFEQRLREAAPRLRALRRICVRNPELGRAILRFAENRQRLDRLRRAWRENKAADARRRIRQAIRSLIADNLEIEIMVLADRAEELERQRQQRIEFQLQRLLDPETDLSEYPQRIQELVLAARSNEDPQARRAAMDKLRQAIGRRLDADVLRLRRRAEQMRSAAPDEVDKRAARFFAQLEKRPGDRPPGKSRLGKKGANERERHRKARDKKRPPRKPRP